MWRPINYANNCFVYLYFTPPGGGINRVVQYGNLNLSTGAFSLNDLQTIIEFSNPILYHRR
jgi:hypothetical protein